MDVDELTLRKVNDFVDDDLLSCFLWAAGENAVAQPGWESPSVTPLKGIPLPPNMPPLPPSASADGGLDQTVKSSSGTASNKSGMLSGSAGRSARAADNHGDADDADAFGVIGDMHDSDSTLPPVLHPT